MEILFTTTNLPMSRLIRKITGETVSHCAIRMGEFVIHSSFFGVKIVPYSIFAKKNKICYNIINVPVPVNIQDSLVAVYEKQYDYGALLFLLARYLFPRLIAKQNLWQATGCFLCTELITELLYLKEDSLITPYKLYKNLTESYKG